MKEKDVESYLARRAREAGGRAYKFISPGNGGVPDRLVCLPDGVFIFVELKAPGQSVRPQQRLQIDRLRALGFRVEVIDSKIGVDALLASLGGDAK